MQIHVTVVNSHRAPTSHTACRVLSHQRVTFRVGYNKVKF